MPKLFGSEAMRRVHYKSIMNKIEDISSDIAHCREAEFSAEDKKKLAIARKHLYHAAVKLEEVRG
jgi:hypothetical protein